MEVAAVCRRVEGVVCLSGRIRWVRLMSWGFPGFGAATLPFPVAVVGCGEAGTVWFGATRP